MELNEEDDKNIYVIKFLALDMIAKANSGHPGICLGVAPFIYTLFKDYLRFNPDDPFWLRRDKFILSAGHGSALLYSVLHLFGYNYTLYDLKNFRQLNSKTPGHPEYNIPMGIEVTTGPLGQGIANSVGLAIEQKYLAKRFNKKDHEILNNKIFVLAGDGCLMEGISYEACSIAGHLKLDNLILIFDSNKISLDGEVILSFSEDVKKRFKMQNWDVLEIKDGNNLDQIKQALNSLKNKKPTIIILNTIIGYGTKGQGTYKVHGAPITKIEIEKLKKELNFEIEEFESKEKTEVFSKIIESKRNYYKEWFKKLAYYKKTFPKDSKELYSLIRNKDFKYKLDDKIWSKIPRQKKGQNLATRVATQDFLDKFMPKLKMFLGGSADTCKTNYTKPLNIKDFSSKNYKGQYINFGVREHAMVAIANGINSSNYLRTYISTFLVFSDYSTPAIRLACLSKYPSIFIFSHDSIGVGEDGPTHQPIEHISYLRSLPNMITFRPADYNEASAVLKYMFQNDGVYSFITSRQALPVVLDINNIQIEKGAYEINTVKNPSLILISSGSELHLALQARVILKKENINVKVVNMLSTNLFDKQDQAYKDELLPLNLKRIFIEASLNYGLEKYIRDGIFIGLNSFGKSGNIKDCFKYFDITVDNIVKNAKEIINSK